MSHTKLFLSLMVACCLVYSVASHAAVYDFGNLLMATPGYTATSISFAQLATKGNGFGEWTLNEGIRRSSFSCFGDNAAIASMEFAMPPALGPKKVTAGADSRLPSSILYISEQGLGRGYSARRMPLTRGSEPNVYTVLLAGLGLLVFSARRRKSDTFD